MTESPETDPALVALVTMCSDRLQRRVTDALNAEIECLFSQGHDPALIAGGCVSGLTAVLFSVIVHAIDPQLHEVTALDCTRHLIASVKRHGRGLGLGGRAKGVTLQ